VTLRPGPASKASGKKSTVEPLNRPAKRVQRTRWRKGLCRKLQWWRD
jgi:hypothetical protein